MERYYRTPRDFESFAYVSQLLQAEGMKIGIEAHRRAKPYCMGSLLLAARRLLARGLVVEHRLLRRSEGALLLRARRVRRGARLAGHRENDTVRVYVVSDRLSPYRRPWRYCSSRLLGECHLGPTAGGFDERELERFVLRDRTSRISSRGSAEKVVVFCAEIFERPGAPLEESPLLRAAPKDLDLPPIEVGAPRRDEHPARFSRCDRSPASTADIPSLLRARRSRQESLSVRSRV